MTDKTFEESLGDILAPKTHATELHIKSIKQLFRETVIEALGEKREEQGKYCGCDGECFANCSASYNLSVNEALARLEEILK